MRSDSSTMPGQFGQLFLWFLIIYLVVIKLRDLIYSDSMADFFAEYTDPHSFGLMLSSNLVFFSYCLFSYFLLYRLYGRLATWQLIVLFLIGIVGCMLFRAFLEEFVIYHLFGEGNYNRNMSWTYYLLDNFYYAIIFCSLGIVFFFAQFGKFNEVARRRSEVLQRETELKFLRSQVNPHFLFNTLNNLYALVATDSREALPAIDKLSGLLRYSLYDHETLVGLDREINYLQDFLELESLRVDGLVPPRVRFGPFSREWRIPPLLLVPFVENAFKHGELRRPDRPLVISLTESGGGLRFRAENAPRGEVASRDEVGGIGLGNVRKRLELVYPGRYTLDYGLRDDIFVVDLLLHPQTSQQ